MSRSVQLRVHLACTTLALSIVIILFSVPYTREKVLGDSNLLLMLIIGILLIAAGWGLLYLGGGLDSKEEK